MTSAEKEIVKQEKRFEPFARCGWWSTSPHPATPSAWIIYKSIYTTQHIFMKLGPKISFLKLINGSLTWFTNCSVSGWMGYTQNIS